MYPCPRSFNNCDVPDYHGKPLLRVDYSGEHSFYCKWLVDYLENLIDKDVPPCQQEVYAELEAMSPLYAMRWLAEEAFYHYCQLGMLERCIEDGVSYEEAVEIIRPWWEEANEGFDPEDVEPFEAWINPQLWEEAKRELAEPEAMEMPATHADIGYRILLAKTLAREPSAEKRLELVHAFYDSYDEAASK